MFFDFLMSLTAIIWDDMLRNVYPEKIKQHGLDKLVELMIWVYIKDVHRSVLFIALKTTDKLSRHFGRKIFK